MSVHVIKTNVEADPIASLTKLDKAWRRVLNFTPEPLSHREKKKKDSGTH